MNKELNAYIVRYKNQINTLGLEVLSNNLLLELFNTKQSGLNNLFMAGLGMGALMIRLGAVFQLVKKLEVEDAMEDTELAAKIIENLKETLPSDTNWVNIWECCVEPEDEKWKMPILILKEFITLRNRFVHEDIDFKEPYLEEIFEGIKVINNLCDNYSELFTSFDLALINGEYFINYQNRAIKASPFIQPCESDSPYVFQGYYTNFQTNQSLPTLINVNNGDYQVQNLDNHYEEVFGPLEERLEKLGGATFNHADRIDYYRACFVGREKEQESIINWAKEDDESNVLTIFSDPGMGKGALVANTIDILESKENKIPVLYHFCGSGKKNNLHSILYHLITKGKQYSSLSRRVDNASLWDRKDDALMDKFDRLPVRYYEAIHFFQDLLDNHFKPPKNLGSGNLLILIDGLDEAAVAYPNFHISDWFIKYDNNGNALSEWKSSPNIRWLFTYRKGFYRFPENLKLFKMKILQPLEGLNTDAASRALDKFGPSEEFLKAVIQKGAIS